MDLTKTFYRDTWAEIDLDAIAHNIKQLKMMLPERTQIMAAVKANGYGHGAVNIARVALDAGATYLGVAILDEALELREVGIDVPILVLGYVPPEFVKLAAKKNIGLTIFQGEWIKQAAEFIKGSDTSVKCHIKIDTGMGRLGIRTMEEGHPLIDILKQYPVFHIEGIYTHYATADELDVAYLQSQQQTFAQLVTTFEATWGKDIQIKHCGNSATALRFSDACYDMVRFGISMYGLSPSEEMKPLLPFSLKEAFSLHSRIVHVKKLPAGSGISYGATYKTSGNEWIGTVPIGYADGWIRANSGGDVLVNGQRVPIVGRICMDQMMISLPYEVEVGTKVTLIGKQGKEHIPVDEVAARLNTINYEVPCVISSRVPRVTVRTNKLS